MKFFLPALGACIVGTSSVFGAIHITDTIDEHGCQTASGYQFQPSTGLCVTPDGQSYDPATTFFPQSVGGT